jgi:hypothetical protein
MPMLRLEDIERERPKSVELPAPTAWPFVMAFGVALLAAGLVTTLSVSLTGAVLTLAAAVGWFRELFPHEKHETVPVVGLSETDLPVSLRERVARIDITRGPHRARLPLEIHPVSAGIKGGLAGSVAMAVLAVLYGVVKEGSIWYPINLLAAAASAKLAALPTEGLRAFHADGFALACAIHLLTSLMVGILYGVMLPMLPRRPIVLGGVIAPVLWSGALYSMLGLLNPTLQGRIDWLWFIASQVAFGIVAGLVVVRQTRRPTRENVSFALRAGVEAPGIIPPRGSEGARQ